MADVKSYAATALTPAQEAAPAKDEPLLSYFYLLLNGWTDNWIRRHYQFEELQTEGLRARLVALGRLEALPKRGYRFVGELDDHLASRRADTLCAYEHRVQQEFLRRAFTGSRAITWHGSPLNLQIRPLPMFCGASSGSSTENSWRWRNWTSIPPSRGTALDSCWRFVLGCSRSSERDNGEGPRRPDVVGGTTSLLLTIVPRGSLRSWRREACAVVYLPPSLDLGRNVRHGRNY